MEFVNFELAKKLKDLGYNVPFFFFYRTDDQLIHHAVVGQPLVYGKYVDNEVVIAPTISQVLNWLREEKYILIGLSPMQEYGGEEIVEWCSTVFKSDKQGGLSWKEEFYYQSYEQAALAAIKYVLDTMI